jgi:hypothetical protein
MNDESMPMPVGSKTRKVCGGCGHRAGQHYPSGCIALVSSSARCGCLIPASDGSATQVDPVAAGRGLDLLALMDERAASAVSPVLAAVLDEAERLRARVAELEAERQATNEWVDDAAKALRANRDRIAELEALKPATIQTCRVCGAGYTYGEPCSTCLFQARMAAETGGTSGSGACKACGSLPDQWCPDCGCCQKGCFDGNVDNPCGHANAPWGAQ